MQTRGSRLVSGLPQAPWRRRKRQEVRWFSCRKYTIPGNGRSRKAGADPSGRVGNLEPRVHQPRPPWRDALPAVHRTAHFIRGNCNTPQYISRQVREVREVMFLVLLCGRGALRARQTRRFCIWPVCLDLHNIHASAQNIVKGLLFIEQIVHDKDVLRLSHFRFLQSKQLAERYHRVEISISLDYRGKMPLVHERRSYGNIVASRKATNFLDHFVNYLPADFVLALYFHKAHRPSRLEKQIDLKAVLCAAPPCLSVWSGGNHYRRGEAQRRQQRGDIVDDHILEGKSKHRLPTFKLIKKAERIRSAVNGLFFRLDILQIES